MIEKIMSTPSSPKSLSLSKLTIMRLPKLLFFLIIVATFAACSSLFNNESQGPELNLQTSQAQDQTTTFNGDTLVFIPIDVREGPPSDFDFPEFTSEVRNNQIIINGYYLASSRFNPEGTISENDNTITIRIQMPENLDVVLNEPQGYFYNAFISNLTVKEYSIEIIHQNDGLRGKEDEEHMVFTKEFVVE